MIPFGSTVATQVRRGVVGFADQRNGGVVYRWAFIDGRVLATAENYSRLGIVLRSGAFK